MKLVTRGCPNYYYFFLKRQTLRPVQCDTKLLYNQLWRNNTAQCREKIRAGLKITHLKVKLITCIIAT